MRFSCEIVLLKALCLLLKLSSYFICFSCNRLLRWHLSPPGNARKRYPVSREFAKNATTVKGSRAPGRRVRASHEQAFKAVALEMRDGGRVRRAIPAIDPLLCACPTPRPPEPQ